MKRCRYDVERVRGRRRPLCCRGSAKCLREPWKVNPRMEHDRQDQGAPVLLNQQCFKGRAAEVMLKDGFGSSV